MGGEREQLYEVMGRKSVKTGLRERLILLHECPGIGWNTLAKMMQFDPTLTSIYTLSPQQLIHAFQIPPYVASSLYRSLHSPTLQNNLSMYKKRGIQVITYFDDEYPDLLKEIYRPPWVLYCKGDISLLKAKRQLAVVGTRKPTAYGRKTTRQLVQELVAHDFVITSGLARGIDYEAHIAAINAGGKTIAVIAGGFNHIYPREHRSLAERIGKDHLIVSEYPPWMRPEKYQFPERNRIISGLNYGTLVVEARKRSGSLITASMALEEGRIVFSVPGPIDHEESQGTNRLIQEGASPVMSIYDILAEILPLLNDS